MVIARTSVNLTINLVRATTKESFCVDPHHQLNSLPQFNKKFQTHSLVFQAQPFQTTKSVSIAGPNA
jgi:hypothetical protein